MSRNYQVGYRLGQGKKLDDILNELGAIAEGVKTSQALCELAKTLDKEKDQKAAQDKEFAQRQKKLDLISTQLANEQKKLDEKVWVS